MKEEENKKDEFFKDRLDSGTQEHKLQVYLIKSIENSSKAAEKLKNKILWLNIVLTVATAVGAFATFWLAFCK